MGLITEKTPGQELVEQFGAKQVSEWKSRPLTARDVRYDAGQLAIQLRNALDAELQAAVTRYGSARHSSFQLQLIIEHHLDVLRNTFGLNELYEPIKDW